MATPATMGLIYAASAGAAIAGGIGYLSSKEQIKSAEKIAKKQRAAVAQRELQAGEYFEELTHEQMELQSQMSQIKLLSDVITSRRAAEPVIMQLPAAKTYTPVERMNSAIDDFLKRR